MKPVRTAVCQSVFHDSLLVLPKRSVTSRSLAVDSSNDHPNKIAKVILVSRRFPNWHNLTSYLQGFDVLFLRILRLPAFKSFNSLKQTRTTNVVSKAKKSYIETSSSRTLRASPRKRLLCKKTYLFSITTPSISEHAKIGYSYKRQSRSLTDDGNRSHYRFHMP